MQTIQCGNGGAGVAKGSAASSKPATEGGTSSATYDPNPTGSHEDIQTYYTADPKLSLDEHQALTGMSAAETKQSLKAVNKFTGVYYSTYRKIEFEGKSTPDTKAINRYIKRMPKYKGEIYRGVSFNTMEEMQKFLVSMSGTSTIGAMSSFSSSPSVAKGFASGGNYGVILKVKSNHSGASIKKASNFKGEDEVLVPKGTKYNVLRGTKNGKFIELELEEVP